MRLLRHLPRFRYARQRLAELEACESWSVSQLSDYQLERINRIWRHATRCVEYYSKLQATLRLPDRFVSLEEYCDRLPVLERDTVRHGTSQLLSSEPQPGRWQFTGGSTGAPTRIYWPHDSHRRNLLTRYRCQQMWGVDFLAPQAMLWGHAASFAPGWRGQLARATQPTIDWLRGRARLSAYQLGESDLAGYLDSILRSQSQMLYGYSAAVLLLARHAKSHQWRCPSLQLAMLTGEPAFDWLKQEVETGLHCPAVVEYGSVDCGVMATEHPDRNLRVRADAVFLETAARQDGCYDILVTSLINESFPLFRYRIGDVTNDPLVEAENGFPMLPSVTGRQNDLLRSRSGRLVHSLSVKHTFEHSSAVQRFQAHQDASGALKVYVELADQTSIDKETAVRRLESLLEGFPVAVEEVDALPKNAAGKHRWVISELVEPAGENGSTVD